VSGLDGGRAGQGPFSSRLGSFLQKPRVVPNPTTSKPRQYNAACRKTDIHSIMSQHW